MAKESKPNPPSGETYGEVVGRLEDVVKKLEAGELPLEDSLKAFEEGILLVRRGEKLLSDAEKRVEELLKQEGEDRVVPLQPASAPTAAPAAPAAPARTPRAKPSVPADDDDVPF